MIYPRSHIQCLMEKGTLSDSISFYYIVMCVLGVSRSIVSGSLRPHRLQPTRLLSPWNSPGKNTGVDCHSLLQRNFPPQGLSPGLLHRRQILYHLSYREVSGVPIISNSAVIGLSGYTLLKTLLAYCGSECSKVQSLKYLQGTLGFVFHLFMLWLSPYYTLNFSWLLKQPDLVSQYAHIGLLFSPYLKCFFTFSSLPLLC